MIIHMIDSLSDHRITLRRYRFGTSSSAEKMASRKARNISCHPRAAKHPHGAVTVMHRALDCPCRLDPFRDLSRYNRTLAQSDLVSLSRSLLPRSSRRSSSLTGVSSLNVRRATAMALRRRVHSQRICGGNVHRRHGVQLYGHGVWRSGAGHLANWAAARRSHL